MLFFRAKKKRNQECSVLYKFMSLIIKVGEFHLVKFQISLELSFLDGLICRTNIGNTVCCMLSDELLGAAAVRNLFWLLVAPGV